MFVIEKVPVGGYCKQNEQCEGSENNSRECLQGRCVCKAGYVLSNLECHVIQNYILTCLKGVHLIHLLYTILTFHIFLLENCEESYCRYNKVTQKWYICT